MRTEDETTDVKTLILIRHAKSSWGDPGSRDRDRPLNHRGRNDATKMGERLAARLASDGLNLDAFLCSPACRAMQTATLLTQALAFPESSIDWRAALYLASPDTILGAIRTAPDTAATLALLAHNPGVTELAEILTGRAFGNVPTCGIITLQWPIRHWVNVGHGATLLGFDYPKL